MLQWVSTHLWIWTWTICLSLLLLAIPLACQGSSWKGGRSDLPLWIRLSTCRLRWMRERERERGLDPKLKTWVMCRKGVILSRECERFDVVAGGLSYLISGWHSMQGSLSGTRSGRRESIYCSWVRNKVEVMQTTTPNRTSKAQLMCLQRFILNKWREKKLGRSRSADEFTSATAKSS